MEKIGFFGLGQMGSNIADRLLTLGYNIISVKRGKFNNLKNKFDNFELLENPKKVSECSDIIISCVDTINNLEELVFGDLGVIKANNIPKYFLDLGTGKPSFANRLSKDFENKGCLYVDMPIGRTPQHALEGKINLFISSTEEKLKNNIVLLKNIAENLFFLEKIGEGTRIKLINNFYGQAITLIFGKLLNISKDNEVKIRNLYNVMNSGPLGSPMLGALTDYYEGKKEGNMEFSIKNAYKDLSYFKEEFFSQDEDHLINLVLDIFKKAIDGGNGEKSVAEIANTIYK